MRRIVGALVLVVTMAAVQSLSAQAATDRARERMLDQARAGTTRYQDVNHAIEDGFKRVGVEFPAMGEHWVNLARVLDNKYSADRPSVLIYVNTRAGKKLAGVGYTALLGAGETPPATAAPLSNWHEHNGSVADESFGLHEAMGMPHAGEPGSLRLAILHAWVWSPNPRGPFMTDNWTLPMVRMGKSAPAPNEEVLRGIALGQDETGYYRLMLDTGLRLQDADVDRADLVLDAHEAMARRELEKGSWSAEKLAAIWSTMWTDLERIFPSRSGQLRAVRSQL